MSAKAFVDDNRVAEAKLMALIGREEEMIGGDV